MSSRNEVDKKNNERMNKILFNYPSIVSKYIDSMPRKTSFTKLEYARYTCRFLEYVKTNKELDIYDENIYQMIKPMDIDSYMESIRFTEDGGEKSGMYRAAQLAAIKGFFKFLKKNNIVSINPCEDTEVPKETKEHEITTISKEDYEIIMHNIEYGVGSIKAAETQKKWKSRDLAILTLGISTGLRLNAMVGIDVDDIDFSNRTITVVEKSNKPRIIYIGEKTARVLENWLCDRELLVEDTTERAVFVSQTRKRMSARGMERVMERITYNTSVKITPHKMRATCATRLYEATGDIYLVQQQLGHKSIKNTERYAKVSNERRIQAANILDSTF